MRFRSIAALLLFAACSDGGEPSLREGLESLPRDTTSGGLPTPVAVDTGGAVAVDTLPATVSTDSGAPAPESVPFDLPVPGAPNDTRPWVPEGRELDLSQGEPGAWSNGVVARSRPRSLMTVQTAIRTASHPEFDRVVLELAGDDVPGYHLEYVDRPIRQCGSGTVVPIAGDGWLRVRLEPAQAHDDEGRATVARESRAFRPASLANVVEVRMICDFEGQVEWVIGVRSPNRYRVLELSAPSRIVIDIQD